MNEPVHTTVQCHASGDGTGDAFVELPPEVLDAVGVTVGNLLSIELIDGEIVLKPLREADPS